MLVKGFDATGCEMTDKRIDLNPNELLGLCQVLKVSDEQADVSQTARLLTKAGGGGDGEVPPNPLNARLLSKIGDGEVR